jgi:hypothetical protein
MARQRPLTLHCPICKKPVRKHDPDFPFCSERCRVLDLGKWASGAYVVSSPLRDTDEGVPESSAEDRDDE